MKDIKYIEEENLVKKATELLLKELGPLEAIRFLTLPRQKRMNSLKRHREWQKRLDKDLFFNTVFSETDF